MKIQPYRRLFLWGLALLYILLPFVEIKGESALRFDVPTLRLYFFGSTVWVQEFFWVMLVVLFMVLLFFLATLLFGRVWCGWFCPQTVWVDLTEVLVKPGRGGLVGKIICYAALLLTTFVVAFSTVGFLVSPYKLLADLADGSLERVAAGGIIVIAALLFFQLCFIRRTFCATICPYAKFQGAITDNKTLTISMDEQRLDECVHCHRCVKACPTGLDIRKGMQVGCIMCAACVDACSKTMGGRQKRSLINYRFGSGHEKDMFSLDRPGVIALFLLAMVPFSLFSYGLFYQTSFDFSILPHGMAPRYTKGGDIVNAYILSIKNMTDADISLVLAMENDSGSDLHLSLKKHLLIPAELVKKVPLFIRGRVVNMEDREIVLTMHSEKEPDQVVYKKVYFVVPEAHN